MSNEHKPTTFWQWMRKGSGGKPGWRRLINAWNLLDLGVGAFLAYVVEAPIVEVSKVAILLSFGLIIGMLVLVSPFSSLMRSREVRLVAKHSAGGWLDYVYTYQASIFAALIVPFVWAFVGAANFGENWFLEAGVFALTCLVFRECWSVINGVSWLLQWQNAVVETEELEDPLEDTEDPPDEPPDEGPFDYGPPRRIG